ncbi:family 43 glycosylhydrolase [Lutibacter citreus]|uniref:family 43 glycosylhydrolase n=1 Tax=Lutibacter citreus TaxID=2138210 RepID=UPI000DBE81B6|nr:family 43 glycosylhydrolase [Lutibacter citreus]
MFHIKNSNNFKVLLLVPMLVLIAFSFSQCKIEKKVKEQISTVCNPMDLSYRFMPDGVSRREAADPTVILFKDTYFLFASKSGGYWYSDDLTKWTFIETNEIPTEEYAPTAIVINNEVYFLASNGKKNTIYKSADPKTGKWEIVKDGLKVPMTDPAFFLDDDNKLFIYWGCSNKDPIYGVEIDKNSFEFIGETKELLFPNPQNFGWEIRGDYNTKTDVSPWLEGAWMNKHNGKYYLQYSAPGTLEKSYCDGVYESENPLGPFTVAKHNSFAYKPEGFACGAGHGSTFEDKYGNFWHVGTITISVKHKFERRIGFYPVFFDKDDVLYSNTKFGDFPMIIPKKKIESIDELFPNWMLLSYNKPIEVSSELEGHPKYLATDEEIRTFWSAKTGEKGGWLLMDLEKDVEINAIQVNFAEQDTKLFNRQPNIYQQFLVEYSSDKEIWKTLVDKTKSTEDAPHNYLQLKKPIKARYVKITNYHTVSGKFAISDLRVFGNGQGNKPQFERTLVATRNKADRRQVKLNWNADKNAFGYNIRYGTAPEKLYLNYQVLKVDSLTIRSLSKLQKYYFTIDTFNENGIKKGSKIIAID